MSTLNQIHLTSRGFTNVSCNCIIHSTFAGQLQSDVKCERCGNVTSTVDPVLDISLELKGKGGELNSENSLAACLRRSVPSHPWDLPSWPGSNSFTQPEKLGQKEYSCSKCGKATHVCHGRLLFYHGWLHSIVGGKQTIKRQKIASSFEFSIQSNADSLHYMIVVLTFSIAIWAQNQR